jgi:hypothetical protein
LSANLLLYSSHHITTEELAEVILQAGGILTPESAVGYFGGLVADETYIWIFPIPCYEGVFDHEGNPLDEDEFALLEQAEGLLGGKFQAWIYISLNTTPTVITSGSLRLAIRFAHLCCQRWPCVIDNNQGRIFSCEEIEQLYKEDGNLLGRGEFI